ncbi:MAG: hypothetical protein ABSF91_11100 [Bacteroidota bacterium]
MVIETGVLDDFISLNLQSLAIKGKRSRGPEAQQVPHLDIRENDSVNKYGKFNQLDRFSLPMSDLRSFRIEI